MKALALDIGSAESDGIGQGLRFVIAGAGVAGVYILTTLLLADAVGLPFEVALAIGFAVSTGTHFLAQRYFVWRRATGYALQLRHQARRYLLIVLTQYGLTALLTSQLPSALGLPRNVVYVATVLLMALLVFVLLRARVFHSADEAVGTVWPKSLPALTATQERMYDDFVKRWHEVLPQRYGFVERFNHSFPVRNSRPGFVRTLEIGCGLGEHIRYERLTPEQESEYHALELRGKMAERIRAHHPRVQVIVGDCQARLDFPDGHFQRYIAVHVLEHLPDLPACVREAWRVLDKDCGQLLAVIPCEGSPAYWAARRLSAQRLFERMHRISYAPFIAREHINLPVEILTELLRYFTIERRRYFPFPFVPLAGPNLCIGLALRPRAKPEDR